MNQSLKKISRTNKKMFEVSETPGKEIICLMVKVYSIILINGKVKCSSIFSVCSVKGIIIILGRRIFLKDPRSFKKIQDPRWQSFK